MAYSRSFQKNGGGTSIDLYNPDVVWQGDLTSTGTHSISVTKKPRFIVWSYLRATGTSDGTHLGGIIIFDTEKPYGHSLWYGASGYVDVYTDALADRIPTLSSSTVTVKGNGSYTTHNHVAIYY